MPPMPPVSDSPPSDKPRPPKQERVLTAALRCHLCGETCGVLESPPTAALPPVARFTPVSGAASERVLWQRLRCQRCGSRSLFVDDLEIVTKRIDEPFNVLLEKPRRGRPPRWLVELRQRMDAA